MYLYSGLLGRRFGFDKIRSTPDSRPHNAHLYVNACINTGQLKGQQFRIIFVRKVKFIHICTWLQIVMSVFYWYSCPLNMKITQAKMVVTHLSTIHHYVPFECKFFIREQNIANSLTSDSQLNGPFWEIPPNLWPNRKYRHIKDLYLQVSLMIQKNPTKWKDEKYYCQLSPTKTL